MYIKYNPLVTPSTYIRNGKVFCFQLQAIEGDFVCVVRRNAKSELRLAYYKESIEPYYLYLTQKSN